MPRSPARITQAELARVLRAVESVNSRRSRPTDVVWSVEFGPPDYRIRIVPFEPGSKRPSHVPSSQDDFSL